MPAMALPANQNAAIAPKGRSYEKRLGATVKPVRGPLAYPAG